MWQSQQKLINGSKYFRKCGVRVDQYHNSKCFCYQWQRFHRSVTCPDNPLSPMPSMLDLPKGVRGKISGFRAFHGFTAHEPGGFVTSSTQTQ